MEYRFGMTRIVARAWMAGCIAGGVIVVLALLCGPVKADIVSQMQSQIGRNPTGWAHRWCGRYLDMTLARLGYSPAGTNLAIAFRHYGTAASPGSRDAIAVMRGHVGVGTGNSCVTRGGRAGYEIISGNHGHRVGVGCYPANRIVAWRNPVYGTRGQQGFKWLWQASRKSHPKRIAHRHVKSRKMAGASRRYASASRK